MRTSSADRDRATDLLKAAYGEGRLTRDEFDVRCSAAMRATTYGDLAPVVSDLPGGTAYPAAPAPYRAYQLAPQTSGLATGALVFGVLEFFTAGATSIPAVILGHLARAEIRRTGRRGSGMATAGLVLGYMAIIGWTLFLIVGIAVAAAGAGG